MDLVEFLNARLDEDDRVARATAASRGTPACYVWEASPEAVRPGEWEVWTEERWRLVPKQTEADATHIARHDPARVLAEVDAKRLLLADHPIERETYPRAQFGGKEVGGPYFPFGCGSCHAEADTGEVHGFGYCLTWKALALPYADHVDYDEAWRP